MSKNEICEKLVMVCNTLNSTTVTGVQNAGNIFGCHSTLQEVLQALLSCEIISPEDKRKKKEPPMPAPDVE